ncbi:arylesterase [Rhodopseudomonas palustris]|uniref:Arylesterase n=2 Tax=Rhodopseudomonas palustris TaxID=1076 RepID=A0A418VHX4_RHOPL|nr:arylesterase [Rhodopseudomonas palustris]
MAAAYGNCFVAVERLGRTFAWAVVIGMLSMIVPGSGVWAQETPPLKVVALGDSLTAGYGLPADAAFPVKLQKALAAKGIATTMINAGVSGDTTSGGLERLDWSVPPDADAVILELGANDALRGTDPKVPRQALEEILKRLKARNIPVLLAGMLAPPNYGPDYAREFNAIYPDLAKQYGVPLYPFFLDGVAAVSTLNQPDGLHPTAAGVDRVVENILPSVEAFLRTVAEQKR